MPRYFKFAAVGLLGVAVQLAALQVLLNLGAHYLLATALSVETALLHNYAWHRQWTWPGRAKVPYRLLRFHLANGLLSLLSNLLWMRLLTGWCGLPPLAANLIAIAATSVLNFVSANSWVFAT